MSHTFPVQGRDGITAHFSQGDGTERISLLTNGEAILTIIAKLTN